MSQDLFGNQTKENFDYAKAKCRGCNKMVIWGVDDKGNVVPLDPVAPVYTLSGFPAAKGLAGHKPAAEIARAKRDEFMVSHFATCPKASQFSRSNS